MNENSRQDELEKFKKEFVDIKSKKSKLIDLMVEDKISEKTVVKTPQVPPAKPNETKRIKP